MVRRLLSLALAALALAGCEPVVVDAPPRLPPATAPGLPSPAAAARNFSDVVARVEPVAEQFCRQARPRGPCNFTIRVDNDPSHPPNAFQSLDRSGRPQIIFTVALIANARNGDELAFILGHEAAHHIAGHHERTRQDAIAGAALAGVLASVGGADGTAVIEAQRLGAEVGSRRFSKDYELEADAIGTRIALAAGFDPLVGAAYFQRIADPGNRFLGTHPPNAARISVVRATVAQVRSGN